MKRHCEGCRAYQGICCGCDLGYRTELARVEASVTGRHRRRPLEECPKPRTYAAWVAESQRMEVASERGGSRGVDDM